MLVGRAAAAWQPLRRLLELDVPDGIELSIEELGEMLDDATGRLEAAGIEIQWADGLDPGLEASLVAGGSSDRFASVPDAFDGEDPVALSWQLQLDRQPLDDDERIAVAAATGGFVRLRGRDVLVGPRMRDRALKPEVRSLTSIEALAAALTGNAEVDGTRFELATLGWLSTLRRELLKSPSDPAGRIDPEGLSGQLRPYQREGLAWLERMVSLGLGGCLADDMGLGKTVMLISLHLARNEADPGMGPTLVVCPTSILPNWEREVRRFAPGESVIRYHGPGRSLEGVESGFVITSYGTLRSDVDALAGLSWGLIAADEAQQPTLAHERHADEPVRRADELHHLDFTAAGEHRGANRVPDEADRDDEGLGPGFELRHIDAVRIDAQTLEGVPRASGALYGLLDVMDRSGREHPAPREQHFVHLDLLVVLDVVHRQHQLAREVLEDRGDRGVDLGGVRLGQPAVELRHGIRIQIRPAQRTQRVFAPERGELFGRK
jgi:hypothetical protein